MENVRFRRAKLDDFNAVMEMSQGIYAGIDYMPAMYHEFLQSPDYVVFVGELEGKLVYLLNYYLYPDKAVANSMSLRVHPEFRSRGLGSIIIDQLLHQEYPTVQRLLGDAMIGKYWKERLEQPLSGIDILYKWNILTYKFSASDLRRRLTAYSAASPEPGSQSTVMPSHQDMLRLLNNGNRVETCLNKFATDYFPSGPAWLPVAIEKSQLIKWINKSRMCVTLNRTENHSSTPSSRGANCGDGDILAISSFSCIQADVGVRADINFFGSDVTTLLLHVHSYLRHLVNVCVVNCGIQIHFPTCVDAAAFEKEANSLVGDRYMKEPFNNEQAFLHTLPIQL